MLAADGAPLVSAGGARSFVVPLDGVAGEPPAAPHAPGAVNGGANGGTPPAAAAAPPPAAAKKPPALKLPFEEYTRITNALIMILLKVATLGNQESMCACHFVLNVHCIMLIFFPIISI